MACESNIYNEYLYFSYWKHTCCPRVRAIETNYLWNMISIPQRSYQFGIWNDFEMSLKIQKIQLQQNSKDFDAELKIKNKNDFSMSSHEEVY